MKDRIRFLVLSRDRFRCRYCGRKPPDVELHVDHVIPRSKGGAEDDPENLVTACEECNLGKANIMLLYPNEVEVSSDGGLRPLSHVLDFLPVVQRIRQGEPDE